MVERIALNMVALVLVVTMVCLLGRADASSKFVDCSEKVDNFVPFNGTKGEFQVEIYNATYQSRPLVVIHPQRTAKVTSFPLVVFMHGSTGQIEMYYDNLVNYASHGFIVVFPYIKSPEKDKNPLTTNTDGTYIIHGIEYTREANKNSTTKLFGLFDEENIVVAGHSMGATCSIKAATKLLNDPSLKLVVTQHPGVCGPFGPPPLPATWMPKDLKNVQAKVPVLFTTATNDGAFWPAPYTAQHELGCFRSGTVNDTNPAYFIQFSADACNKDNSHPPFDSSGHDCPFKSGIEFPWTLTAMKLYAQQGGSKTSNCMNLMKQISADKHVDQTFTYGP